MLINFAMKTLVNLYYILEMERILMNTWIVGINLRHHYQIKKVSIEI